MPTTSAAKTKQGQMPRARPSRHTHFDQRTADLRCHQPSQARPIGCRTPPGARPRRVRRQNEPRLIAFNEYVNDTGTEVTVVQVHPDAASMQNHLGIVGERAAQAYEETLDATLAIQ